MTLLISISALCLAGRANAQGAPTAESSVTPNISQESVKGAGVVFRAAEKMQGATGRMNAAMLKRRDACMALARAVSDDGLRTMILDSARRMLIEAFAHR